MISINSEEAKNTPRIQQAIEKEKQNFVDKEALDFQNPREQSDVIIEHPDAEFVDMMMLVRQKNAEVPDIPAPIIEDTQAPWWLLITGVAGTAAIVAGLTFFIARPKHPDRWENIK
mgnify:CR=1 FL=1